MGDLKQRFGRLVSAHRRRLGWTQRRLAEAADLDEDTIGRIEIGRRGVSFGTLEKLASALQGDPAELFTSELPGSVLQRTGTNLTAKLAGLNAHDIAWLSDLIDAALKPRRHARCLVPVIDGAGLI